MCLEVFSKTVIFFDNYNFLSFTMEIFFDLINYSTKSAFMNGIPTKLLNQK